MKIWDMHLNLKINRIYIFLIILLLVLISCETDKTEEKDFIARVENTYLSKEKLQEMIEASESKYIEEIVKNWIKKEILYRKALDNGIVNSQLYKSLINRSQKELAVAIYLDEYYNRILDKISSEELENFFIKIKKDFKINSKAFYMNTVEFNNREHAKEFRSSVLKNGWFFSVNSFDDLKIEFERMDKVFVYEYQIYPPKLLSFVEELREGEISPIIEKEPGRFTIVKLISKFRKGVIPDYNAIKDGVYERYISTQKKVLLKDLINSLYKEYEVEVRDYE
ncbi:peptidyl-prolyl cis-trans isomerase [Bacteroidota bacterium]